MNKWEERLCDKNDNRKLLIESSEFTSKIKLNKTLKESLVMQSGRNGTLIVKNVPVTILDRENLNGRIYSTETMRQAIEEAREAMADKQTLGQANEHPESSFVAPTDASHVIINAYIKENVNIVVDGKRERHNVLFTDWEVLNTTHGKDLRALFEAECSFGTSIRGVGELNGKMVENYSFISVDGVGNPSSSTYTRMPVSESVKVEFKDANELKENYTVMSSSTNVVRDLSQAGILQQQLNANPYGTITKTSTKVDQETDPKTGAQTSITTVEADTEDEVTDLNQAFQMAHKAMTNGISKVNSVTIEANEDEDEQGNKTESVDMSDNGLEAYVPESTKMIETNNAIDDEIDRNQAEFKRQEDLRNTLNNIGNYFLNILNSTPSTLTGEKDYDDLMFDMYNMFHEVRSASTISFPFDDMERAERISKYEKIIKEANELISRYKKLRPESVVTEGQVVAQGQPEGIEFLKTLDEKGRCMFLGRMQADCKYFLDNGHYYNKFLWANNPEKQIEYMKWLYNSFPDDKKPEWISMEEIEDYERQMVGKGKEDHSRDDIYTAESAEINPKFNEEELRRNLFNLERGLEKFIDQDFSKAQEIYPILDEVKNARTLSAPFGDMETEERINAFKEIFNKGYALYRKLENEHPQESVITEAAKKQDKGELKDPNEGRQYVLKIKNNDPEMKEDSDNAPEFVAMRGNAIRFTKDPKKALHFTQGMEESGIVHCSNIKKLLADMGYGEQNLEKWYKKDNNEVAPRKEGITGGLISGALDNNDKKESAQLTEDGNTKYSATMEIRNGAGLPEMKSVDISSVDLDSAKKELGNHCTQQESSSDGRHVEKATLVDNQTGEKFNYDPKSNQLVPENGNKVQQQAQPVEEPKFMDPENVELGVKEESTNGEIEQNDKTLDMDIDDNTHIKKEFDTQAQASVAKAGIESGKLSGDVLLSDAVKPGWYVAHDKIGISGPYETREACMEGLDGYEDQVSVYEVTENDLNEVLFKNPTKPSDDYIEKPLEESSLVPVRFSNIKWDEKDAAYRMFEDIEKDMQVSHIEPNVNNADVLVEYFDSYMNDLKGLSIDYNVNPNDIKESVNYKNEILEIYNQDKNRQYPKIKSADINLR